MRQENGRKFFYQWELDQRLIVDEACTMVQFANGTLPNALGVDVKELDGVRYAEVPNVLLQTAADLRAYAWDEKTKSVVGAAVFPVYPMEKPGQYAYTQTEVKQYDVLLKELEKQGAFYIPTMTDEGNVAWQKTMDHMPDAPEWSIVGPQGPRGEVGPQGIQGPKGPQGPRGEPGPQGVQGVQGIQGLQGSKGERGEKGEKGDPGPQGERGEKGEKGDVGPQGPKGDPQDAVRYTKQTLTPQQQAQARENMAVEEAVLKMLIEMEIAPVLLDADGTVLSDNDGAILLNL